MKYGNVMHMKRIMIYLLFHIIFSDELDIENDISQEIDMMLENIQKSL